MKSIRLLQRFSRPTITAGLNVRAETMQLKRWCSGVSKERVGQRCLPKEAFRTGEGSRSQEEWEKKAEAEYSEEELQPGPAMLRRILADLHSSTGHTFILPWNDNLAMEKILQPIKLLLEEGVKPSYVLSACSAEPSLLSLLAQHGDASSAVMATLVDYCRMPYEEAISLLAGEGKELLKMGADGLQKRFDRLMAVGLDTPAQLKRTSRNWPTLLYLSDDETIGRIGESLSAFFSRKEIAKIVQRSPTILLQNVDEVEEKVEYIFFQMCIESDDLSESAMWSELQLEEIIERHQCLLKSGRYSTPEKRKTQMKMENPTATEIFDTTDQNFACSTARISLEEWILFKEVSEKMRSGEGMEERSFVRVKPSQRKAFERRKKMVDSLPSHTFDSTTQFTV